MKLSRDYLLDALEKLGDMPEAKKAELFKVHKNTMNQYKRGERIMDDYMCILVARELGIDELEVIAAANMEREKNQQRREFWANFRKQIGQLAVAGLLILGTLANPANPEKTPQGV